MRYKPAPSCPHRDFNLPLSKFEWRTLPIKPVRGGNRHDDNDLAIGQDVEYWQKAE